MRTPAEVFPPGEFLREELEERGWTQTDLAAILDRPIATVNEIISGKRGITPESAQGLAAALGTTPELWMNLDTAYQLSRLKDRDRDAITRRAKIYEKAPIKDMIRRGWIGPSVDVNELEQSLLRFFKIETIDEEPELPRLAAKISTTYDVKPTPAQTAWLFRTCQLAQDVRTKPYGKKALTEAVAKLRRLLKVPGDVQHVPSVLSEAGVRLVLVEPLPRSKIDGACVWMDKKPTIAMSLRFDRLDNFWFVLMHEVGHALQGTEALDIELGLGIEEDKKSKIERDANDFAMKQLVPQDQLGAFIENARPHYSAAKIESFAQSLGVHPALVVGQLQHRREISFSSFRKMTVPVREHLTETAATDGWNTVFTPKT